MFRLLPIAVISITMGFNPGVLAEEEWQASSLSAATIQKLNTATKKYHECLNSKVTVFNRPGTDSRDAANWVMKQCEAELNPVNLVLTEEKVPPPVIHRYLRRKHNQAARKVLQVMMYAESMNSSGGVTP